MQRIESFNLHIYQMAVQCMYYDLSTLTPQVLAADPREGEEHGMG